jgi:IS5 family transposase
MREKVNKQMPLISVKIDHPIAAELEAIGTILDQCPIIYDLAMQDLSRHIKSSGAGDKGMTAEQVVRTAIVKQLYGYSYEQLSFRLADSLSIQRFCRTDGRMFCKSVLCSTIKMLRFETLEQINSMVLLYAKEQKIEDGKKVRIDCTVTETNIHRPSDSSLLWDGVRVLTRLLIKSREYVFDLAFVDHRRVAKARMLAIDNAKNDKVRRRWYKDLVVIAEKTVGYAQKASERLAVCADVLAMAVGCQIREYIGLVEKVIDQTRRRVMQGQCVPAGDKIVSLFEPHTDIIIKDRRDTYFGHKLCLSTGASQMITDCVILEGNPADVTLVETMLKRHEHLYDQHPRKVAMDGGFASKENLQKAKELNISDVCFAKKRGLQVSDMCRSQWVYNQLRRFRAGVEAGIAFLKRCFGLDRCTWKGHDSFKSYVWASIIAANLLILARKQIAR